MDMDIKIPKHIAIIMDGNGRWADDQKLPRMEGYTKGVERVRELVEHCDNHGVQALTLFVFSTENWQRPKEDIGFMMEMFLFIAMAEAERLHENNVRLRVIGDRSRFSISLNHAIGQAESLTAGNSGLALNLAVNYGGHWDITQAAKALCREVEQGKLKADDVTPHLLAEKICLNGFPLPDLCIRTGGERRISNFLLWQMAYCELYFVDMYWPDFNSAAFDAALQWFTQRQRRFGKSSEQVDR